MNRHIKGFLAAAAAFLLLTAACGCTDNKPDAGVSLSDASTSDTDADSLTDGLSPDEQAAAGAILKSAEAMNARDIEAYMSTVDPESKVYESTREDAGWLFARYRLAVTVDDIRIDSISGDTAVVTVTQTTVPLSLEDVLVAVPVSGSDAVSGTDIASGSDTVSYVDPNPLSGTDQTSRFTPCVTVLEHTLTRRDGVWYISSTVILSYREISTQWDLFASATAADASTFILSGDGSLPVSPSDTVSDTDPASAGAE